MDMTQIKTVKIKDINTVNGLCYIEGYLKDPFSKVTAFGGSYGNGVLVDDEHKISLRLTEFDEAKVQFIEGNHLRILGSPLFHPKLVTEFSIRHLSDINKTEAEDKTADELRRRGLKTPKRKHDGEGEMGSAAKQSPFDN
ncbi:hypothetical protein KQX54_007844 [Cotesia glomerata]|uniref:Uncharacterized protein n=2 Tax=Cotesia glomerata TaxID=32391 RepID=A0AAV7ITB2_COTGL|nr:hypothetical protein KQX54_007844 [Cotesia glomerata]